MIEWFASHDGLEQVFPLAAIVGGLILGDATTPITPATPVQNGHGT